MDTKRLTLALLGAYVFASVTCPQNAYAVEKQNLILIPNELNQPLDIEPFTIKKEFKENQTSLIESPDFYKKPKASFKSSSRKDDRDMDEKILSMVPQGHNMKKLWKVVDGDVDLHFEGLRADRSNKGLKYKTNAMPLIGEIRGTEFEFSAGEDMEFGFKSNRIPFAGEVEGFQLKGSVSDDAKISARYTYKFD